MQLQELVQWVGLIAALKRGQPGGEVISSLEIDQGLLMIPELLEVEGIAASRNLTEMSWNARLGLGRRVGISWC